jgi:hypothetical protein
MYFKRERFGGPVLAALICWFLPLGSARAQSLPSNISELKGEMKVFEAVIDGTMSQTFAAPFGILEKTHGTYLPGFGLAFSLEVNLYQVRSPSPFDTRPLSKDELEKARKENVQRIASIKGLVPRLLADHATSLRELKSDGYIAVVVHLFNVQSADTKFPGQLVIESRKSDLDQFWDKKISYQDLLGKMTILEL